MKTLIIAEAGVNHNGDLDLAKTLIRLAAEAGADLIKFQTFKTEKSITRSAPKANYQITATANASESQYEMVKKLELSEQAHKTLIAECKKYGIGFFSTAFDPESADFLENLGMDMIKIPSGELTNLPFLQHLGQKKKKTILSTGMATLGEIEAALDVLEQAGTPRQMVTVLHCTTEYPTPMEEVNLRAMLSIQQALGVEVGYSDHTRGIEIPIAAVALGATIIEKHFTLDRTLPGPDHQASIQPDELCAMVQAIRNIEQALGDGIKRPTQSELNNRPIARKSIVAAHTIRKGELLTRENLTVKRPGTGISPMRWNELIGKTASRDFSADELIEL